jgi:peptidoglycan/xylan/chitin deacetylase (PgdA/CDA1 family)
MKLKNMSKINYKVIVVLISALTILAFQGFAKNSILLSKKNSSQQPKIILKLDDLTVKNGVCECLPTFELLRKKQIKGGFGIIASRCDNTASEILTPYLLATNDNGEKLFEIWHHGLDHVRPEFSETPYSYQKLHFNEADKQVRDLLNIQMQSFGTPYNASDSITNRVVSEYPVYKVFMFSKVIPSNPKGIIYLTNRTNIENGTGNPEFEFFLENYQRNKEKYSDYMVLQAHPNNWTPEKLDQFEKIIDFLIKEGCEFILPIEMKAITTPKTIK